MSDSNLSWTAIGGTLATVGVAAAGVAAFVNLQRDLEETRKKLLPDSFAKGFVFLSENAQCPSDQFTDITANFDRLYLFASKEANGTVFPRQGDGSHTHTGDGTHEHGVTGMTDRLGGGERYGSNERHAAHMDNRVRVNGTALAKNSDHSHKGGQHEHAGVGFRLCRYIGTS